MTTVYVVTSGEYSEYHIEAVFSTLKLAKHFAKLLGKHDDVEMRQRVTAERAEGLRNEDYQLVKEA